MISPSSIKAIGPPTAASGDTCPIEAPLEAPEKRPSVINATAVSYTHLDVYKRQMLVLIWKCLKETILA